MDHNDTEAVARQADQARWEEEVREWEAQGLLTPDQILKRIDKRVQEILSGHLSQSEHDHLEQNLDAICDGESSTEEGELLVDPSAFTEFLIYRNSDDIAQVVAKVAPLLLRMLVYMSNYPLAPPAAGHLTKSGFRRAIVHATPRLAQYFIDSGNYSRERTLADIRRLVFQGLACHGPGLAAHNEAHWTAKAQQRATEQGVNEDAVLVNRDGDGDEIYHDLLDFLFSTQPEKSPWYAPCHRDGFRGFAKTLRWSPPLHELMIPRDVVETLAELARGLEEESHRDALVDELLGARTRYDFELFDDVCGKYPGFADKILAILDVVFR
ncbi:hypothetical protein GQ53DRAFT_859825 [Thozetella sp. PMI_491]|nr:hypothetical protein GQ53DRAFT_859825 [Thozetella sp. PMI_491]